MEGGGLRAEGETMDGREQTPSGMGSGVDLELYVDSDLRVETLTGGLCLVVS